MKVHWQISIPGFGKNWHIKWVQLNLILLFDDCFFFLDKWNTGDLLYPALSEESDIIPQGKLLVEVEKMGISVDGEHKTAKVLREGELQGEGKCRTEVVNKWNSSKVSVELSLACFVNDSGTAVGM